MRLFTAIDLDEPARAKAEAQVRELARLFQTAGVGEGVRWISTANVHLTVRFIGEVEDPVLARLQEQLAPPVEQAPFDLTFNSAGAFPQSGPPRVIWMGVGLGLAELRTVHAEIERRVQSAGLPADSRPFAAHLTVGRIKHDDRRRSGAMRRALETWAGKPFGCRVTRVTLYRSRLKASGSEYEPLLAVQLRPATGG